MTTTTMTANGTTPYHLAERAREFTQERTEFSDGEMGNDALSLHSDIGDDARRPQIDKRRRRGRKNKGGIRLFGKAFTGPGENDNDEQRRISRLSSSTLHSGPPVEDGMLARLSTNAGQSQVQQLDEDTTTPTIAAEKDKLALKEKRRQLKLSSALLNVERIVGFVGFQGRGNGRGMNGGPSSLQAEEEFRAFQETRVNINSPDVADADCMLILLRSCMSVVIR